MNNNKQSSVEWYANEEDKLFTSYQKGLMSTAKYILFKYKLREQAKAMHKEECIKYYVDSIDYDYGDMGQHIRESFIQIAEKMYNKTFGGNNEQQ